MGKRIHHESIQSSSSNFQTLYKDANRNITYNVKLTLAGTAVTIRLAIVRTVLQPIAINTANLSGGYGSLGNGISAHSANTAITAHSSVLKE